MRGMSNTTYSKLVETQVEQARDHVGIERAHFRRPVGRGDHGKAGGVIGEHHLQQLPVETVRARPDFGEVEAWLKIEIVGDGAVLEIEIDQAGGWPRRPPPLLSRIIAVCTASVVTPAPPTEGRKV